jgi:diacylglycerol kinase
MIKFIVKKHTISFTNAFNGLVYELKTQPNFKIHFFFSFISIIASIVLKISTIEWMIIIFLITVGLAIESVNSAIEAATDAIDTRYRPDIKVAKDIAAAAMLIFALGSSTIALLIFFPKILVYFK